MFKNKKIIGVLLLLFSLSLLFSIYIYQREKKELPVVSGSELIGGDFSLTNHLGQQVTQKDFSDKYLIVFFGFTHCPEICPLGLSTIMQAYNQLGDLRKIIQPIYISVDPERDSPKILAKYVKNFGEELIGLSGSMSETKKVVNLYRAYYRKTPLKGDSSHSSNYLMDHSSIIYFMNKKGKYMKHFSSSQGSDFIAEEIKKLLE